MKQTAFFLILGSLAVISCSKDVNTSEVPVEETSQVRTFVVSSPETRTTLNDHAILWGADDKIRVIGYSAPKTEDEQAASEQAVFDIVSGVGEKTASFSGIIGEYDTYFAIYPSDKEVKEESLPSKLDLKSAMDLTALSAVENGFDPSYAIMTAIADENGKLVFRHGVAYIKIQVAEEGISAVRISLQNNATGGRPVYNSFDGSTNTVESGKNVIMASGSFVKDSYYYFPVPSRASNPGKVTVEYTKNGLKNSISTSSLEKVRFEVGKIWDLGCPPIEFTPVITYTAPAKLEYNAESGSFAYHIECASDQNVSATLTEGNWIVANSVTVDAQAGLVSFSCAKNDASDAVERSAKIKLSYAGAEDVVVTVTQKVAGGVAESHAHVFYYASDGSAVNLTDGENGSYFTATAKADLGGDYNIKDWAIGDYASTKAVKMNSDGKITFTTSSSLTSTLQFYFIRRKEGDSSAKIQLVPASGNPVILDTPYDTFADSGELALEKGLSYTIQRKDKEQAVLLVIVHENE